MDDKVTRITDEQLEAINNCHGHPCSRCSLDRKTCHLLTDSAIKELISIRRQAQEAPKAFSITETKIGPGSCLQKPESIEAPKAASVCSHDPELPCIHSKCEVQKECASEPKSESVQSAEDTKIIEYLNNCIDDDCLLLTSPAMKIIEADRAAQRQVGREEMEAKCRTCRDVSAANMGRILAKRYAAVIEAARDGVSLRSCSCRGDGTCWTCRTSKALADLGEVRKG
jgi:hypothetical protein